MHFLVKHGSKQYKVGAKRSVPNKSIFCHHGYRVGVNAINLRANYLKIEEYSVNSLASKRLIECSTAINYTPKPTV